MGNFFKFADLGNVQDVIAPVMQVIARLAHGAQRGVACGDTGQGDGFLGLEGWGGGLTHGGAFFGKGTQRGPPKGGWGHRAPRFSGARRGVWCMIRNVRKPPLPQKG